MKKMNNFKFSLLTLFLIGGANAFSQAINDPGVHPEGNYTDAEMDAKHASLEGGHAYPKIESFNAGGYTLSTTEFWPAGTWNSGYLNSYNGGGYTEWYEEGFSNHPLIRTESKYILGYLHANRSLTTNTHNADFQERALSGIDNLVNTQRPDGSYIWWRLRPSETVANTSELVYDNAYGMYVIGFALKALSEGYWYKKCHLGLPATEVKDAIILCADFVVDNLDADLIASSNANERGLVGWAMSTAYKVTGDIAHKDAAITLANRIIISQFPEGDWAVDAGGEEGTPAIPVGGPKPIQEWIAGDFDGDGEDELLQKYSPTQIYLQDDDLKLGKNNIYYGVQHLEKWLVGNFDNDPEDEVLHKFVGSPYIYIWNYGENFGVNSVYTGAVHLEDWICGDFDDDDTDEVLQKYAGSNTIYLWGNGDSFGSNSIYTGGATIENWLVGNFDDDANIEVLQKYAGSTNVYLWNFGATFGANSIYAGPQHIENWIASDFDADGKDEVLQKYVASTYIYLWDEAYSFGTNSIYTGPYHLGKWVAGDFDGDGRDEVIQKYDGIPDIYEWNYGTGFNASKPYDGLQHTVKWIVANSDGGVKDELFQVLSGTDRIYYWDNPINCMGCYSIFNLPEFTIKHDSRMQYHFFILGALIETYSITSGPTKENIAESIKKGINHVIASLDPTLGSPKMSNYYYDTDRNVLPLYVREQNMFNSREAIQLLPQLAYYAKSDPANFTTTDVDRIINLANRMVNPDLPGYAYYKDYMNAINDDTYLDYYGGCEEGVFVELEDDPIEIINHRGKMDEPEENIAIKQNVYPNPVRDILNISDSKSFLYAEVYNSIGMSISKHNSTQLNLENLASGVYMLKIYRKSAEEGSQDDIEVQTEIIIKQ